MKKSLLLSAVILLVLLVVFFVYYKQPEMHIAVNFSSSQQHGKYLKDMNGMTLYFFSTDPTSEKACDYKCLKYWKPFITDLVKNGDDSFMSKKYNLGDKISIVKRLDGLYQYSYNGNLLYRFVGDEKSGDMVGLKYPDKNWKLVNL
jgi:predicted lipoprotein with Yx(FWY)xxD motif